MATVGSLAAKVGVREPPGTSRGFPSKKSNAFIPPHQQRRHCYLFGFSVLQSICPSISMSVYMYILHLIIVNIFFKFGTNLHLDLGTNWLDFGGQWSKSLWLHGIALSGTPYFKSTLWKCLKIRQRHPIGLRDIPITIMWSNVKVTVTSPFWLLLSKSLHLINNSGPQKVIWITHVHVA